MRVYITLLDFPGDAPRRFRAEPRPERIVTPGLKNMIFIDTHFHAGDFIPDMRRYCAEAAEEGVKALILCAGNYAESLRAAQYAAENPGIFFAAGVHPHEADGMTEGMELFRELAAREKFAAVGEIGLDFYYDTSDRTVQRKVFAAFLSLALELGVPALIHCRDREGSTPAYDISLEMLADFHHAGGRYLLHCFAGTEAYAEKFLGIGAMFGVGGMLTFKMAENIRRTVSSIPLERLVLETDAPYLAPVPFRGRPNHSRYIPLIAEKLAFLKGISLEQCAARTTENARRFFNLPEDAAS